MGRLEDGRVLADVRARRDPEAADQPGGEVADDVAVEVRQHEDVELLRPLDELHRERVDEHLARGDVRVVGRDLAEDGEKEPVRELHDVRLRHAGDLTTPVRARVLEREADDPLRRGGADGLHGDARAGGDLLRLQGVQGLDHVRRGVGAGFVLDARVEVLRVLAHDDEVDILVPRAHPFVRLARAQAGVQPELVAQRDVDRAEAGADRRGDRPLQGHAVRLHRRERLLG